MAIASPWIMRIAPCLLAVLPLLSSAAAVAQESSRALPPAAVSKKNLLQGSLGLGSPVGALGLSYAYMPVGQVEIEVGGGVGFTGYQVAVMPKLALGASDRLVLGLGPSLSIDASSEGTKNAIGYWLNGEIGYRHTTAFGLSVLAAVGVSYGLSGTIHTACGIDCAAGVPRQPGESIAGKFLPEMRIALGRAF
jgi:hypothetical protein